MPLKRPARKARASRSHTSPGREPGDCPIQAPGASPGTALYKPRARARGLPYTSPGREPGDCGNKSRPACHPSEPGCANWWATSQSPSSRWGLLCRTGSGEQDCDPSRRARLKRPARIARANRPIQAPGASPGTVLYKPRARARGLPHTSPGREPGDCGNKSHPACHAGCHPACHPSEPGCANWWATSQSPSSRWGLLCRTGSGEQDCDPSRRAVAKAGSKSTAIPCLSHGSSPAGPCAGAVAGIRRRSADSSRKSGLRAVGLPPRPQSRFRLAAGIRLPKCPAPGYDPATSRGSQTGLFDRVTPGCLQTSSIRLAWETDVVAENVKRQHFLAPHENR